MIIFEGERKRRDGDLVFVYIFRDTSRYFGMHFLILFLFRIFQCVMKLLEAIMVLWRVL